MFRNRQPLLYEQNPTGVVLIPKSRWTSQPQVSSEIDWSHPSSTGLVRSVITPFPRDLVTKSSVTLAPLFPSWNGTVNASDIFPISYASGSEYVASSTASITFLISIAKVEQSGGFVLSGPNGQGPAAFLLKADGRPLIRTQQYGADILSPTTGPAVNFNEPANLAVSFPYSTGSSDPRTLAVYWNGFLQHSNTITRTNENWANASFFRIGSRIFLSAVGPVSGFWLWNRELTPSELVSLTRNPWQLLKKNRFIFPAQTAGVTANNLLANDLQSSSSVSTPSLGQTHGLLANDLQSASSVSTPTLGQTHVLLANDLQSTSSVSTPSLAAFANVDTLLADNLESLSTLSTPALGQTHEILANDLQSASSLSTPTVGQVHVLLADNLQSVSSLSTPSISQTHVLLADNLQSLSTLSTPSLGSLGISALLADDLESVSVISTPTLLQRKPVNYVASVSISSLSATTFYQNTNKWYGY
jgi:hypothetical protein